MSISTLYRYRPASTHVPVDIRQTMHAVFSPKSAEIALFAGFFRRRHGKGASLIDTCHMNDHVLKDIGLDRFDVTKPE